jgi:hypothetical protein
MQQTLLVLILLALCASPAWAQSEQQEAEARQAQEAGVPIGAVSRPHDAFTPQETFDTISDFGLSDQEAQVLDGFASGTQSNSALLRQDGHANEAFLGQVGAGNLAVVLQEGTANVTTSVQVGQGNVVGVRLRGDGNRLGVGLRPGVVQIGEGNLYLLDVAADYQTITPTTQFGTDNQVVQLGETAAPFGVQQFGNGMRMIIRHNGAQ